MGKSNMIKRADGSYSKRGLWDNIRANKGSGKKPTKQMLEQEAKIKAKSKYADGGKVDDFNYERWRRSLPENLQTESPNYNLRGYWESLNKPDLFNPFEHDLNEDGAYHASSRDPRTGEILKGKLHPTLNLALKNVDDQGNVYTPYMKNRKIYTHTYDSQGNEQYGNGGKVPLTAGGEKHLIYRKESPTGNGEGIQGHIMVNHPTMNKGKWDTIDLTKKSGAQTVAEGIAATKKWHAENPEYGNGGKIKYPFNVSPKDQTVVNYPRVAKNTNYSNNDDLTNNIQLGLDLAQLSPLLSVPAYAASLPFTTYDVVNSLNKGDYTQAGVNSLGYIPTFKAYKYALKAGKILDNTSKLAKNYKKINNVVNTVNIANDAKKQEGGYVTDSWLKKYDEGGKTKKLKLPVAEIQTNVNTNPIALKVNPNTRPTYNGKKNYIRPEETVSAINEAEYNDRKGMQFLLNPLPSNTDERNPYNYALDVINPVFYAKAAVNTAKNLINPIQTGKNLANLGIGIAGNIVGDEQTTDIAPGIENLMDAGLALPKAMPVLKNVGKRIKDSGVFNGLGARVVNADNILIPRENITYITPEELQSFENTYTAPERLFNDNYNLNVGRLRSNYGNNLTGRINRFADNVTNNISNVVTNGRVFRKLGFGAPEQNSYNRPNWSLPSDNTWANYYNDPKNALYKPKPLNRSGLTKEELLNRGLDKDVVEKMSEGEFKNTVLKPTGEITPYYNESLEPYFTGKHNVTPIGGQEYTNLFNRYIDRLNEIIFRNNKSGIQYRVKSLSPEGVLTFETPEQTLNRTLTPSQQEHWDMFHNDYEGYINNKVKLKETSPGNWTFTEPNTSLSTMNFNSKQEAEEALKEALYSKLSPRYTLKPGTSTWSVGINPGKWQGEVLDIPSKEYYRGIPGLDMRNTTGTVFADRIPRKGTKAYESINEYLKELDLGRVKPGFNSQTQYSRGAWENFVKSGRGYGFYGDPKTVYGSMRPYGGYIYEEGGIINELKSKLTLKPNQQVSDNHIIQLYENLNLGKFNKKISDYLESFKDGNDLKNLLNKSK
jgi:hypothetical protein